MLTLYQVEPEKLYQSPAIKETQEVFLIALKGIDVIFDLSALFDPYLIAVLPFTYVHQLILDLPLTPDMNTLRILAITAHHLIHSGRKVLTHCTMGRNRSSLLNGLILQLLHPDWSGRSIVDTIKRAVPDSLTNKTFEHILLDIKPEVR